MMMMMMMMVVVVVVVVMVRTKKSVGAERVSTVTVRKFCLEWSQNWLVLLNRGPICIPDSGD